MDGKEGRESVDEVRRGDASVEVEAKEEFIMRCERTEGNL